MWRGQTTLVIILWTLVVFMNLAEGSPFLWALFGGKPGRSREPREHSRSSPRENSYGDLCRIHNPSSWTAFGYSEPNCPP